MYTLISIKTNEYIQYANAQMGAGDGYTYSETILFRSQNRGGIWNGHIHSDGSKAIMASGTRSANLMGVGSRVMIYI